MYVLVISTGVVFVSDFNNCSFVRALTDFFTVVGKWQIWTP